MLLEVLIHGSGRAPAPTVSTTRSPASRAGDPAAVSAFQGAGGALGAAVATIVNLVDPEKVVVTGEGLPVLELAGPAVERGLRDRLDPATGPVPVTAHEFHFGAYARAAAITAVRHVI